ncbi:MAG: hypothetical protein ACLP4V_31295 [Methylocella sp.]
MTHYEASRPVTELRNGLRAKYLEQIERAGRAVLAVPAEPRSTYRLRVTQAAAAQAPDVTERDLFSVWRNHPELSHLVNVIHNQFCNFRMGQIAEIVEQCLQDEAHKDHVVLD